MQNLTNLLNVLLVCHVSADSGNTGSLSDPVKTSRKAPPTNLQPEHSFVRMSAKRGRNTTNIMAHFENSTAYDHNVTPTQSLGFATNVSISMYIEGLLSFSAETMDFQVDIYFQEAWIDHRLRHKNSKKLLIKETHLFERIWKPDLYFANAREATFHDVTAPNFLVWIQPNGSVYYDARVSLKVMCMMDLSKYPLDSQRCHIRILSYAYDEQQLVIRWMPDRPINRNSAIKLASMRIESVEAGYCNAVYSIGVWSCTMVTFLVRREMMHHILQHYVPTALLVMISWSSFWLDVDSVPGRVTLCITTLLTLATQAQSARQSLPQVSYVKAIDVWMNVCLAFGFGVMIEFTFVNYLSRRKPRQLVIYQREAAPLLLAASASGRRRSSNEQNVPEKQESVPLSRTVEKGPSAFADIISFSTPANPGADPAATTYRPIIAPGQRCGAVPATAPVSDSSLFGARIPGRCCSSYDIMVSGSGKGTTTHELMPCGHAKKRRSDLSLDISRLRFHYRKLALLVDRYCRTIFPSCFVFFNLVYWPYYIWVMPDFARVQKESERY